MWKTVYIHVKVKGKQSHYRPGVAREFCCHTTARCALSTSSPVTGLEWPRGFQEVKVPRFRDNGTGRLYPQEILLVLVSVRG